MADERSIIFDVKIQGDLISKASEIKKSIDELKLKNSELSKSQGDNTKTIIENESKIRLLNVQYKNVQKEIDIAAKKFISGTDSIEKSNNSLKNYGQSLVILQDSLTKVNQKLEDNKNTNSLNEQQLKELLSEQKLLNDIIIKQDQGFINVNRQIRENTKALFDLEQAGLKGTDTYRKLLNETGKLKDESSDLAATIKTIGSDTKNIEGAIQVTQGLVGIYGIAQGAAEIFGDENKELQESFVKLQAAMTILNGLQSVYNLLQKETAGFQLLLTIRTNALAVAKRVYSAAVSIASASTRAFAISVGIATGGLTILLGLLASSATAADKYSSSTSDAADETENLDEKTKDYLDTLNDAIDLNEQSRNQRQGFLNDKKRELELLEASGASENKIAKQREKIAQDELFNSKVKLSTLKSVDDASIKSNDIYKKAVIDANEEIKNKENELQILRLQNERKRVEEAKKRSDELKRINDQRIREEEEKENNLKNQIRSIQEESLRITIDTQEEELASLEKKYADERLLLISNNENTALLDEAYQIKRQEIVLKYEQIEKQRKEEEKERLRQEKELELENLILEAETDEERERIKLENLILRNEEIKQNTDLSETQRKNLILKNEEEINNIKKQNQDRERQRLNQNLQITAQGFSTLQSFYKEDSKAYQTLASIKAKFDAAEQLRNNIIIIQNQIKALTAQGGIPFPGNLVAIGATLAALVGVVSSAKQIIIPQFADGGVVSGKINPSDGIMLSKPTPKGDNMLAFLRTDEVVLTKRDQIALGGAPTFAAIGVKGFADGGSYSPQNNFGKSSLADQIANSIKNLNISVSVEEINRVSSRVKVLENLSSAYGD